MDLEAECKDCSNTLRFEYKEEEDNDWVKVVCSDCGHINEISVVHKVCKKKGEFLE